MRRNETSDTIYANFRFKGKLFRHSLETSGKTAARNALNELKRKLEASQCQSKKIARSASLD